MRVDSIKSPPGRPRSATERLRDVVYKRRALADPADREIRLPGVHPVHGHGSPPAGMFRFTDDSEERP
jgi:hypothetical protein